MTKIELEKLRASLQEYSQPYAQQEYQAPKAIRRVATVLCDLIRHLIDSAPSSATPRPLPVAGYGGWHDCQGVGSVDFTPSLPIPDFTPSLPIPDAKVEPAPPKEKV